MRRSMSNRALFISHKNIKSSHFHNHHRKRSIYFIPSGEFNACLKQIKAILATVKKYRIFSLVTNTIYIFSWLQKEAVSTI